MSRLLLRQLRPTRVTYSAVTFAPQRCRYSALAARTVTEEHEGDPHDRPVVEENASVAGPSHANGELQPVASTPASSSISSGGDKKKKGKAKTAAGEPPLRRSRKEPGVEAYLASINAAGIEPTLEDLEACRPATHPHPDSPSFTAEYNALMDTLQRSFSKEQLRRFLEKSDTGTSSSLWGRKKAAYAEMIIERMWGWPSLKEIERAKRESTEEAERSFPVTAAQMFLLLGRDGADLLHMSTMYNAHVSLATNPMALRVEGLKRNLKEIEKHIAAVKKTIVHEVFDLPSRARIRQDMIQRISRLADAFLENLGGTGKIRIYAKNSRSMEVAKRLASRAARALDKRYDHPILIYLPSDVSESTPVPTLEFPHSYALYPYLSPRSLPWTMNANGTFRARRVGEWLSQNTGENTATTGGLADGRGRVLASFDTRVDVRSFLFDSLPANTGGSSKRTITASTGHILFTKTPPDQRPTIIPPMQGSRPYRKFLEWLKESSGKFSFVASLPAGLSNSSPAEQKVLHRLTYRALQNFDRDGKPAKDVPHAEKVVTFEVVLAQPRTSSLVPEAEHPVAELNAVVPLLDASSIPQCTAAVEVSTDLMMPDRPMDVRLTAIDTATLAPGEEPALLQTYMTKLRGFMMKEPDCDVQPDPPLLLEYAGDIYLLNTSATIKQGVETIAIPPILGSDGEIRRFQAVSESILDLESNQKSTCCEITCEDVLSDDAWKVFLDNCDGLTTMTYRPAGSIPAPGMAFV